MAWDHFFLPVAPMKALCSERFQDWKTKFERFGLKCKEVTGDSELDDYYELQNTGVIMTTPVSSIFIRNNGDPSPTRSRVVIPFLLAV